MRPNKEVTLLGFKILRITLDQNTKAISLISLEELQRQITQNSSQSEKDTALKLACYADDLPAVQYLLSTGANPNTDQNIDAYYPEEYMLEISDYVINPVLIANALSSAAVLNALLAAGANPETLSTKKEYFTALGSDLHTFLNTPGMQKKIFDKRLRLRNENGKFIGDKHSWLDVVSFYEFGQDNASLSSTDLEELYRKLRELMGAGVISKRVVVSERTHLIFYCSDAEKVAAVIHHDADLSWQVARHYGKPILHDSIDRNKLFKLPVLLENGVDLEERDDENNTPLMLAVCRESTAADELLRRGASTSLETKNTAGENVFDLANGDLTQLIKDLVLNNPGKISPAQLQKKLSTASIWQNVELMKFLCERGANMQVFRQENKTELSSAIIFGASLEFAKTKAYIEYLMQNGFDSNSLTEEKLVKLQKILHDVNPYVKEISQEERIGRKQLEAILLKFMAIPFSMEELIQQQHEGTLDKNYAALGRLVQFMVNHEKCRPDPQLIAAANSSGHSLRIIAYETQVQSQNIPILGLFAGEELVSKHQIVVHEADPLGLHQTHLHGDSELWTTLAERITKPANTPAPDTTIASPNSSHMFKPFTKEESRKPTLCSLDFK